MNKLYRRANGLSSSLSFTDAETASLAADPRNWNMNDVGAYLHLIDLAEYKQNFKDNRIAGADLLELTTDDLIRLGMTRIGHRKQLQRKVAALKEDNTAAFRATQAQSDSEGTNSESSSEVSDSSGSRSGRDSRETPHLDEHIRFKSVFEDRSKLLSVQRPTFDRLVKELQRKWNIKRFNLYYMDTEGDLIDLSSDDDLEEILAEAGTGSPVKIVLKPKHRRNHITTSEKELLESQMTPILIFSKRGRVLYKNAAATNLSGNLFQLLPQLDIESYRKTRESKYVGKKALMEVRMASGTETREVGLTEVKTKSRHTFTATIHPTSPDQNAEVWSKTYGRVTDGVLVTDAHGLMVYANPAAVKTFGYPDLVGQNVKVLMQEEDALKHDAYIRNYRRSGIARVIGTGRTVVAVDSAGRLVPLHLTLIEQKHSQDELYFIGLMKILDVDSLPARTLLQAERETIEALAGAAVIIDETGVIVGLNAKTEQFFGYKYIELISRNVTLLMPPSVGAKHPAYIKTYLETRRTKIIGRGRDVMARHKDGTDFPVSIYVTEKTDGEKILFTGLFSRKISPAS